MRYTASAMEIVLKAVSLANAPMLTETEAGDRARDWMEALAGIVPANRLNDAYLRAFRDHTSAFPLSAYEVKIAWQTIAAEELAANPVVTVNPPGCERCLGTGVERAYDLDGHVIGAKAGKQCAHLPVVEGEGLFVHLARRKERAGPRSVARI